MSPAKRAKRTRKEVPVSPPPPAPQPVAVPPPPPEGVVGQLQHAGLAALVKGTRATNYVMEELLRAARASLYLAAHTFEGQVLPAIAGASEIRQDLERSWLDALAGRKGMADHVREVGDRVAAGSRYQGLVEGLGRELFGSATYAGEQLLYRNGVYRLSYLPAKQGAPETGVAMFFVGGFIPYGDRLFRFLPEANLFDRYLERGIPVYLMELVGDRHEIEGLGAIDVERQIDWIEEFATVAFRHNGGRKLTAQGYCGSGIQLLAYLAARPRDAGAKFKTASLFVTPVDARKCTIFSELVANLPRSLVWVTLQRSQLLGGYLRGVEMWAGLDTSLKAVFIKTSAGRFVAGWKKPGYAKVATVADLSPLQRFELAGAYWISVHNADRFPIPVDLVRRAVHLYDQGVSEEDGGGLGFEYRGRPVTLRGLAEESQLRLTGFFAGQDKLVQEESGFVLAKIFGPRYRHVVHPTAAHVSYACFPAQWDPKHPKAFLPNPIDVILDEYAKAP